MVDRMDITCAITNSPHASSDTRCSLLNILYSLFYYSCSLNDFRFDWSSFDWLSALELLFYTSSMLLFADSWWCLIWANVYQLPCEYLNSFVRFNSSFLCHKIYSPIHQFHHVSCCALPHYLPYSCTVSCCRCAVLRNLYVTIGLNKLTRIIYLSFSSLQIVMRKTPAPINADSH